MKNIIIKIAIAGLIMLQQALFLAVPASTVLLAACATPPERSETRQKTRVEERTEGRYENRR